jgi:DNA modification methylase
MTEKHANLELWKSAPLAEINHPHPKNPRVIPDADSEEVRTLDASLEHDYFDPLIWNKRNRMWVSGHVRAWRMTALGFTHADVVVVDYSEETHLARMLAANAHSGKNDEDKLDALLASLRDASVDPVLALLSALPPAPPPPAGDADAEPDTDRAAELNKIWQVEPGQVWQIGPHRLMCGDSTKAEDVAKVLIGKVPLIMVTDPPYGVELDQSWRDKALGEKAMGPGNKRKVDNDDRADWRETWALFPGDVAYVWHAGKFSDVVMASLRASGFEICQQLVWNKSVMVMGRSDYHFKHEPCWYAVKKGKTHGWIGDRKQTTVIDAKSPNHIMSGSDEAKTEHPTQKPVECMAYLIRNHSGDVYDPFLGSGTTMVAAQNLHRICYGMEISPDYCAVILDRMHRAFPDLEIKRVE